jgi:hypothetical protein
MISVKQETKQLLKICLITGAICILFPLLGVAVWFGKNFFRLAFG